MTLEAGRPSGRPPLPTGELARRKRAIVEATLRLVAAQGAAAVRLRDVARAAGVSVGSLQYYFDSRDQLIREAFDQHARAVVDLVARAGDRSATPPARLAAVIEAAVLRADLRFSAALWMEFVTAGRRDDQLRALLAVAYEAWRELLAEVVRAGTESGDFRPLLPPATVVACLVALIDGFELAVAIDVADATPAAIAEQITDAATALLTGAVPDRPGAGSARAPLGWAGGDAEQGHDPVHLARGAAVQHRDPVPQLPVPGTWAELRLQGVHHR